MKYSNEPFGELRRVKDFLPSPDELAFKEENVKVTLSLSKASIEFFKDPALLERAGWDLEPLGVSASPTSR